MIDILLVTVAESSFENLLVTMPCAKELLFNSKSNSNIEIVLKSWNPVPILSIQKLFYGTHYWFISIFKSHRYQMVKITEFKSNYFHLLIILGTYSHSLSICFHCMFARKGINWQIDFSTLSFSIYLKSIVSFVVQKWLFVPKPFIWIQKRYSSSLFVTQRVNSRQAFRLEKVLLMVCYGAGYFVSNCFIITQSYSLAKYIHRTKTKNNLVQKDVTVWELNKVHKYVWKILVILINLVDIKYEVLPKLLPKIVRY